MKHPLVRLALIQLIGNALLLWLGYYWLGVGEADSQSLAISALSISVVLCGAAWLHGAALAYFREPVGLKSALIKAAKRAVILALMGIAVFALYLWMSRWNTDNLSFKIASFFTMTLQTAVRPATVTRAFNVLLWLIRWCLLPVLLLPLASGIAANGWRGVREFGSQIANWKYWIAVPLFLVLGVWLPLWLASWTPAMGGFGREMTSLILRLSVGYLLFVGAALALAFVTSRGRPVLSQLSTAPSP